MNGFFQKIACAGSRGEFMYGSRAGSSCSRYRRSWRRLSHGSIKTEPTPIVGSGTGVCDDSTLAAGRASAVAIGPIALLVP
jgi:hypothetical protein